VSDAPSAPEPAAGDAPGPVPERAALVVVSHRSAALLEKHLARTVAELSAGPDAGRSVDVVVVDNSPAAEDRARAREVGKARGWLVVESPNEGFGAGANLAVRHALERGAQAVLVVNPDLGLPGDVARALLDDVLADPERVVAPVILGPQGATWFSGGTIDLATGRTRANGATDDDEVAWLSGACIAVAARAWERIGGFDERFFLYWEDVDLSWRARAAGLRLAVRRDLVATHEIGGTQEHAGTRRRSDTYYEENCRNRLVFAAHHLDPAAQRRWALGSVAWARAVVLRGGKKQLLQSPGPWLAVTRGTLAGLRYLRRGAPAWPAARTPVEARP